MGIREFIYTVVQQAVREVITKEVNTRIDSLEVRINEVEKGLNQRINEVEKGLNQRINEVEQGLSQRINEVEKNLNQRINEVEQGLNQRINEVEKSLIERFEVRFDNIEKALATVQGNLEGEARFFHLADYLKSQQSQPA